MSDQSKLWYLENFNLFNELSMKEKMSLAENTTMKHATKHQFIYFPEQPSTSIFFLKEGKIKLGTYSDDGREIIKAILQPGEIFGELGLVGEENRNDFAQAMDDQVMICAMDLKDMEDLMARNTKLSLRVTKLIGWRLRKVERRLESLIFKDARSRIVDFLKETAEEKGTKVGYETLIQNYLTHKDIANLTATSRQTVTTVLNELRDKNLIYFDRKRILIRDLNKLE